MKNAYLAVNERFNFIEGNREVIDERHIRNIMNSMMNGEFIPPILVDEKTRLVIDGQHRCAAAYNLWKQHIEFPLGVIMADFENPLLAAIKYNNSAKNWRTSTYVNAYIKDGRESYKLLKEFCKAHNYLHLGEICKYSSAILMLTHSYTSDIVKNGNLVITKEQCVQAEELYQQLAELKEFIPIAMHKEIIQSWIKVKDIILRTMSFDNYLSIVANHFVAPASSRLAEWENAFLKIIA